MELLRLEYLNAQEEKSVINLISNSQDRFHIPGERLTATNVLQHQIPTTDDRPINTRQYRFPQLHKEEINKLIEVLLEGGIVKPSQLPYAHMDNSEKRELEGKQEMENGNRFPRSERKNCRRRISII